MKMTKLHNQIHKSQETIVEEIHRMNTINSDYTLKFVRQQSQIQETLKPVIADQKKLNEALRTAQNIKVMG